MFYSFVISFFITLSKLIKFDIRVSLNGLNFFRHNKVPGAMIWEETYVLLVVGSNPSTVFCIDFYSFPFIPI